MHRFHISPRVAAGIAIIALAALHSGVATAQTVTPGTLVKGSQAAVYYVASDKKRYAFPNENIYKTWYADFSLVQLISDADLAALPLGGNVGYRPGARMVKLQTDPKVYAVDQNDTLRPVQDEATARALYGDAWNKKIDDLSEGFFAGFTVGDPVTSLNDFNPNALLIETSSIDQSKGFTNASQANLTTLPLGDDRTSSSPTRGYIYSCQTSFNGGGAFTQGPWISNDTWDLLNKTSVDGSVEWSGSTTVTVEGNTRVITSNGLPTHPTGSFPISSSDDAYNYDRNPNTIASQNITYELPANPVVNATASCVGGEVGIALTGAQIFNGFDAGGRDAVATEVQDSCQGHPQSSGIYHYHGPSTCSGTRDSELFGYALDGFGIFSNVESGKALTNTDLDECHGHAHEIVWDGEKKSMYHYHLTQEFPYTVGCFRGTAVKGYGAGSEQQGGMGGPPGGGSQLPPPPGGGPPPQMH